MKKILLILLIIILIPICINYYVIFSTKNNILSDNEIKDIKVDAIIVLGAKVYSNRPSHMLSDRIDEGVKIYKLGVSDNIIMSGDHGRKEYDEVNMMKSVAIEKGIQSSDIFMDHAGFSTYDSIYRAKEIFGCKKVVIVTQKYHLYRALYIADKLGMKAYGYYENPITYVGQNIRDIREILARNKDFLKVLVKSKPKILGDKIPLLDGDSTNDY